MIHPADRRPCRGAGSAFAALGIAIVLCAFPVGARCADLSLTRVLDPFDALAAWQPLASDDVSASIASAEGPHGTAMRLDFDLAGTAGYAIARRALPLDMPPNYEISFYLRADAPVNNFQFKFVDASGDNVWWFNRPNVAFPREWQLVTIEKRQIAFAWGPTKDRTLSHVAAIEFVVSAGRGGGRGSVYLSELRLRELPSEASDLAPTARPPSQMGAEPSFAIDGTLASAGLASDASPNAFFESLARASPRGTYPRGFLAEASSWTLVGVDGGSETGLLSEDGALEVAKGGFSIEPFVVADSQVITWADVAAEPFLVGDYLPMPGVTWHRPQWDLRVSSFAFGSRAESRLVARYELTNHTRQTLKLTLVLAARPFQVNPPVQFLNTAGGASPIHDAAWTGSALSINATREIFPLRPPDRAGVFSFKDGPIPRILAEGHWTGAQALHDPSGYASAALAYELTLPPRGATTVGLVVPLSGSATPPALGALSARQWIARQQDAVAAAWRAKLNRVSLRVPAPARPLVDTMRTALAHLLITRDGPVLRPGTRSYARSWIRDGAMISESLLRLGYADVAADYLRWYAPHQFRSGKVPCCVDERGADPVAENDSPGEFIFLVEEIDRYTHDRALLEAMWPHVEAAIRYAETLRQSQRTDANLAPARRAFYGLMPASISHEGYSEKPMHSYWDDFWTLKGYADAVSIATTLGRADAASRIAAQRDEFRRDLTASLQASTATHGIAYLPGSAELGDFDPTSTTIAFAPRGDVRDLPPAWVRSTYERYWREFIDRRDGSTAWDAYTPYELRNVGTFIRLGWRDRAQELLAFFLDGRRPAAWHQWPEVIGRNPAKARFVGDMPHAWVASDFIGSALDLFAYERNADQSIVLAAGIPSAWLDGAGISVRNLRTPYGLLSYSLRKERGRTVLTLAAGSRPPGHFVFVWPWKDPPRATLVNGRAARWQGNELRIDELPARVVVEGFDGGSARDSGKAHSRSRSADARGQPG
jgi:hypothetical protein